MHTRLISFLLGFLLATAVVNAQVSPGPVSSRTASYGLFIDGSAASPGIAFANDVGTGFYRVGHSVLFASNGVVQETFNYQTGGSLVLIASGLVGFPSSSDPTAVPDTSISRISAGVFGIGTGTQGSFAGSLKAATVTAAFHASNATSTLTITSNVIAPTNAIHHLGAGLVKTITVPAGCSATCSISIIPDAAFTTDATGNISLASTAVVNKALIFVWDGTAWSPSY